MIDNETIQGLDSNMSRAIQRANAAISKIQDVDKRATLREYIFDIKNSTLKPGVEEVVKKVHEICQ